VPANGRDAKGQALAGALPLADATGGRDSACWQIHHLFKSME